MKNNIINNSSHLTSGALLTRNTFFSLLGEGIPLLVAIFAIPILINGLGTDRFGVLTLALLVIGYFSIFDIGLGRALTKLIAERLGSVQEDEIPSIVSTSLFLMLIMGMAGAVVLGLLMPWLVHTILNIPKEIQPETLKSFYLLVIIMPFIITSAGLKGILEAMQRFDIINAIRIFIGIFTYLCPLLVLIFSRSIFPIVLILTVARLANWIIYMLICIQLIPALRKGLFIKRKLIWQMLHFGSLITVSNIISPLMVNLDKFMIGALLTMEAVAYYTIPFGFITKLWIIPGALAGVIFPAFSTSFVQDKNRTTLLLWKSIKYIFLILFPITLIIVTLGGEGIELWLGNEFAQHSTRVLQWLAIGVFVNSLAHLPFALIQGIGRPDITAKLHLIELPFYLLLVFIMAGTNGIEGVAIAWTVRATVDSVVLFIISWFLLSNNVLIIQRMAFIFLVALAALGSAMLPMEITIKAIFLMMILSAFALSSWFLFLAQEERAVVQNWLSRGLF